MKTERMVARDEGWGRNTELAFNGNGVREDENILMGDNSCFTVWLCVMLLNCSRKYILPRDRSLAAGSEAQPGGSVTSPGSQVLSAFQLTVNPR